MTSIYSKIQRANTLSKFLVKAWIQAFQLPRKEITTVDHLSPHIKKDIGLDVRDEKSGVIRNTYFRDVF